MYQIDAPYFCAGFVVKDERVVMAAPIIHYMIEWSLSKVEWYCEKKKWKLLLVKHS